MILLIAITIIMILYILLNNEKTVEKFNAVIYDNINEYLSANLDNKVLKPSSRCFDNDKLISKIKGKGETCSSVYPDVKNIFYKSTNKLDDPDSFYDIENDKQYSFAEICPITSKQSNGLLCLRDQNNYINDKMFRINNVIFDTELNMNNNLDNLTSKLKNYRTDKYRLFNSELIQEYNKQN